MLWLWPPSEGRLEVGAPPAAGPQALRPQACTDGSASSGLRAALSVPICTASGSAVSTRKAIDQDTHPSPELRQDSARTRQGISGRRLRASPCARGGRTGQTSLALGSLPTFLFRLNFCFARSVKEGGLGTPRRAAGLREGRWHRRGGAADMRARVKVTDT